MIANYGYKDGSGEFYISIDTDKCLVCTAQRACLTACPKGMFEIMTDDYDDEYAEIEENQAQGPLESAAFHCGYR